MKHVFCTWLVQEEVYELSLLKRYNDEKEKKRIKLSLFIFFQETVIEPNWM